MDSLPPQRSVAVNALRGFVEQVFRSAGCDDAEAGRIARYLVSANLAGHDSHGVIRVPRYVQGARRADPDRRGG